MHRTVFNHKMTLYVSTHHQVLANASTSEFEQRFVLDDEDPRATKLRYVSLCQQHADMWGDQLNQTRRDQEILRLSEQRDALRNNYRRIRLDGGQSVFITAGMRSSAMDPRGKFFVDRRRTNIVDTKTAQRAELDRLAGKPPAVLRGNANKKPTKKRVRILKTTHHLATHGAGEMPADAYDGGADGYQE